MTNFDRILGEAESIDDTFRVQGSPFETEGLEFGIEGFPFRTQGSPLGDVRVSRFLAEICGFRSKGEALESKGGEFGNEGVT